MLYFLPYNELRCQAGGTCSLITFIITVTYHLAVRDWVLQGHEVLALKPIYVALVLPSISAHCTVAWHHVGHDSYLPWGQPGKFTAWCQLQPMPPYLGSGNSLSLTPFQCYPVTCPLLPGLPPEPTCYVVATGFWVSCWLHQLSCCVSLCALLPEPGNT